MQTGNGAKDVHERLPIHKADKIHPLARQRRGKHNRLSSSELVWVRHGVETAGTESLSGTKRSPTSAHIRHTSDALHKRG